MRFAGVPFLWLGLLLMPPVHAASIADRLQEHGPAARARLQPHFLKADVPYPPGKLSLVALKEEKVLQLYARQQGADPWVFVREYPILAASGGPGPKLLEGDLQVPEGRYRIELLNPNSRFHLSLRVNYPSPADQARARKDGRTNLGGDIMIHGNAVSIGCLAMGDPAIEELFVLAADTGLANIDVLLAPMDFRTRVAHNAPGHLPDWTLELWASIRTDLMQYPLRVSPPPP